MLGIARGEISVSYDLDPLYHGRLLETHEVVKGEIQTLCDLHNSGYLEDKLLAAKTGVSTATIAQRIRRARKKLGCTNRSQLIRLLTVLSGYGARYRIP